MPGTVLLTFSRYLHRPGQSCYLNWLSVRRAKERKDTGGPVPIYNSGGITGGTFEAMPEKEAILIPKKGSLNNVIYASRPFLGQRNHGEAPPEREI